MKQLVSFLLAMVGVSFGLHAQPNILTQPQSTNVHFGATVQFSVSAEYNSLWPHGYQWRFNGSDLADATNSNYTVRFCDATNAGNYSVAVTGRLTFEAPTTVISSNAVLTVTAATYNSTNTVASPDQQSLLSALTNGGVVLFSCDGTIFLTNSIPLTQDTIIDGAGHNIAFDGGGSNRHFNINPNITVTLRNLTLCNGLAGAPTNSYAKGGSVYNDGGILRVESCVFTNNHCVGKKGITKIIHIFKPGYVETEGEDGESAHGGAVYNNGVLQILNSTFVQNGVAGGEGGSSAFHIPDGGPSGGSGCGGAVYTKGVLQILNSTFVQNGVVGGTGGPWTHGQGTGGLGCGGAIFDEEGLLHLEGSVFSTNSAIGGYGLFPLLEPKDEFWPGSGFGGAIQIAAAGFGFVTNALFEGNFAQVGNGGPSDYRFDDHAEGGAICSDGNLHLEQSTFRGNIATGDRRDQIPPGGPVAGGAIVSRGDLKAFGCLFVKNAAHAGFGVGALFSWPGKNAFGGAIMNYGVALIGSCNISDNEASAGAMGPTTGTASGGGIANFGELVFTNNIVLSNRAFSESSLGGGGGLWNTNQLVTSDNVFSSNTVSLVVTLSTNQFRPGGNVVFAVADGGVTNSGYVWSFGGEVVAETGSRVYNRTNLQLSDAGAYTVSFPNDSTGASVAINISPRFFKQPYIQDQPWVNPSIYNYISVGVTGTPLSYQWFLNGVVLSNGTSSTYSYDPDNAHSGTYFAVVSNAVGVVTSESILLNFAPSFLGETLGTFVSSVASKDLGAVDGAAVTLSAWGRGTEPLSYQWYFNGGLLAHATNSVLSFASIDASNAGDYHAVLSNPFGTIISSNLNLIVASTPSILIQPDSKIGILGSNVTFSVTASNSLPLFYQWQVNGTNIIGATASSLELGNLQTKDVGLYSVVIGNGYLSTTSAPQSLFVLGAPEINTQPVSHLAAIGSPTAFSVSAVGAPALEYQWTFNSTRLRGQTSSSLVLSNARPAHAGNYRVMVKNAFGTVYSANAKLTLMQPPRIVRPPVSLVLNSNALARFAVGATGSALKYQWQFNDVAIPSATNAVLVITNVSSADEGIYKVFVSNAASSTNAVATLTVTNSPFDLNQNGETDLLLRHQTSGQFSVWLMKGTSIAKSLSLGSAISPSLRFVGLNDFEGAGQKSLVLQATNGAVSVVPISGTNLLGSYLIDQGTFYGSDPIPGGASFSYTPPGSTDPVNGFLSPITSFTLYNGHVTEDWKVVDVADFNADGSADLLAQNVDGRVAVWLLNGTNFLSGTPTIISGTNSSSGWQIVGVADFNGDGKNDILWQDSGGYLVAWLMDGTNYLGNLPLLGGTSIGANWKVVALADFNYDGHTDLVLESKLGGLGVKFLNNGTLLRSALLHGGVPVNPAWRIVAPR